MNAFSPDRDRYRRTHDRGHSKGLRRAALHLGGADRGASRADRKIRAELQRLHLDEPERARGRPGDRRAPGGRRGAGAAGGGPRGGQGGDGFRGAAVDDRLGAARQRRGRRRSLSRARRAGRRAAARRRRDHSRQDQYSRLQPRRRARQHELGRPDVQRGRSRDRARREFQRHGDGGGGRVSRSSGSPRKPAARSRIPARRRASSASSRPSRWSRTWASRRSPARPATSSGRTRAR